jgi:bifunctional non-homologous end joining protein LigD
MKYEPQLATLVAAPPSGDQWIHEIKFDGYRIGCHIRNGRVTLTSRNGKDWTAAFPQVVEAASRLKVDEALLDGEVAAVLPDGRTSFQAMQQRGGAGTSLVYFVFDLLHLNDEGTARQPLEDRKARLRKLIGGSQKGRIRYSEHVGGDGSKVLEQACRLELEGIISKRRDLPSMPGRGGAWLKIKCIRRQEFVIGGFTDPKGSRAGIGALLLGYYAGGRAADDRSAAARAGDAPLVFAGRVGTGFSHAFAVELRSKLDALAVSAPPFTPPPPRAVSKTSHWVAPKLVCEVSFTEWTSDGQLRHPAFQGLRRDKTPADVVREDRPGTTGTAHAATTTEGAHGSAGRPRVRRNR